MNVKITKQEFHDFKIRFGTEVSNRALSCMDLTKYTEATDYVSNFVIENIINKESINKIKNISYKLANMKIASYASSEEKSMIEFPIVNKYIGRMLLGSYFFERNKDKINEVFIELKPHSIIIP